eukprot:4212883-Pyramimonas_sp.AAC.1
MDSTATARSRCRESLTSPWARCINTAHSSAVRLAAPTAARSLAAAFRISALASDASATLRVSEAFNSLANELSNAYSLCQAPRKASIAFDSGLLGDTSLLLDSLGCYKSNGHLLQSSACSARSNAMNCD